MTKKTTAPKTTKGAQGKLAGTGRLDADEEVEAQSEKVRKLTEQWQALGKEMVDERSALTELIKKKRAGKPYVYEDEDGEMREAFVPKHEKEPQAKVRKLKKILPDAD